MSLNFGGNRIYHFFGDLINIFDSVISESLQVILGGQKVGYLFTLNSTGGLRICLSEEQQLSFYFQEDVGMSKQESGQYLTSINHLEWLTTIAEAFRDLQNIEGVSKEIVLRQKNGASISLLEVLC